MIGFIENWLNRWIDGRIQRHTEPTIKLWDSEIGELWKRVNDVRETVERGPLCTTIDEVPGGDLKSGLLRSPGGIISIVYRTVTSKCRVRIKGGVEFLSPGHIVIAWNDRCAIERIEYPASAFDAALLTPEEEKQYAELSKPQKEQGQIKCEKCCATMFFGYEGSSKRIKCHCGLEYIVQKTKDGFVSSRV